jgi:site-specific recombinase XerD
LKNHTFASLLLQSGENVKTISQMLGHSRVGITLDTYSHVLPGMQESAARRMDGILRGTG